MEKICSRYRPREISRFVDNELSQSRHQELAQHLLSCSECSRLARQYQSLSLMFTDHLDTTRLKIDPDSLKQKFERATQSTGKTIRGNIYLKLASIAAIVMISLFAFQTGLFRSVDSSAIVTSVDTDFSSVMIIETQKKHHTIIWFSET